MQSNDRIIAIQYMEKIHEYNTVLSRKEVFDSDIHCKYMNILKTSLHIILKAR